MSDQQKPWGDDSEFDAEKAWTLIQNLRGDVDRLKADKTALAQERDDAVKARDESTKTVEELQATVQLTDDAVKSKESELSELATIRAKENLLIDAGLPRKYAPQVVGDDEEAWKNAVQSLAELRGETPQERRLDPAQAADPAEPSADAVAKQFFGL
ncbi:hypothetical protein Bra3105_17745 [Brachybacterium halotolerans subsp. kimchii]|uniref:hypothetical protein n=1 Tax=Brachybacterium halotolerans TaxID=2795215 RepID=UPI001E5832AE|nr:hypothetical protein [Brachybacterium halotolerans]UEJ82648.1 hypothetical protein Bra3105_17745 [Brachybacterium halotolerans subsp. kimchii]